MSAFYPNYVDNKYGENISSTMIAMAMSAFEFASMISTITHPKLIRKLGRKNSVSLGYILLSLSIATQGVLRYVPNDKWIIFYICSVAARLVGGFSDSLIQSCQMSLISQAFPDTKAELIGTNEAFTGIGIILGPALGSLVYG